MFTLTKHQVEIILFKVNELQLGFVICYVYQLNSRRHSLVILKLLHFNYKTTTPFLELCHVEYSSGLKSLHGVIVLLAKYETSFKFDLLKRSTKTLL